MTIYEILPIVWGLSVVVWVFIIFKAYQSPNKTTNYRYEWRLNYQKFGNRNGGDSTPEESVNRVWADRELNQRGAENSRIRWYK
jgi:hypothetical protein